MEHKLYTNGTVFSSPDLIIKNLKKFCKRKDDNKPVFIIIDGVPGSGKTTLAVELMDEINKIHGKPEVNLEDNKQLIMGAENFIRQLPKTAEEGYPTITFDEAGEYNKIQWGSKLNKIMNKVLDTFRAYKIIIILVLHDFNELPKHVWDAKLPTCLIHLKERKGNEGRSRLYALQDMYWIRHWRTKEVFPERAYDRVWPAFKCEFHNLNTDRAIQLDKLSTTQKTEGIQLAEMKLQGLMNPDQIAAHFGRAKGWVSNAIRKIKVPPVRKYKRITYYDPNIIQLLEQYLDNRKRQRN